MFAGIQQVPHEVRRDFRKQTARLNVRQMLLACGIVYAVLYPVVNDAIAASLYVGYSRMSQAVSELSAIGAPPRPFLTAVGPLFSLLQIGFGVGMWQSAHGKRPVRLAGALMVGHGAISLLWVLAPMSQREVISAGRGGATSADTAHLILAAGTGLFVAAYVAILAIGFGWRFRVYSVLTLATALGFGRLSAQVDRIEAGDPTPYMGLLERIGIGAWLLWMAVASIVLLRRNAAHHVAVVHTSQTSPKSRSPGALPAE